MFDDDFLIFLFVFFASIFGLIYFCNYIGTESEKEIEFIKKTKDYQIYEKCYEFDEQYYCYNKVEE